MSKLVYHAANTRGFANHGWLKSYHTFSFANYFNEERVHFGALRVLNDDSVAGGMGFGRHPHDNMEIISIPLSGDLEHQDSMGNVAVIREGDVQIMSAGTGITHSETNKNRDKEVKFLQIWVFPKLRNIQPLYDQKTFSAEAKRNKLLTVVAPDDPNANYINQDAWFSLGNFTEKQSFDYQLHLPQNGAYFFILNGNATIDGKQLNTRDGLGVYDTDGKIHVEIENGAELLLMEVPMIR